MEGELIGFRVESPDGRISELCCRVIEHICVLGSEAKRLTRRKRWPHVLSGLYEPELRVLANAIHDQEAEESEFGVALMHLTMLARTLLYGDPKTGEFEAAVDDLVEWTNKIAILCACEELRRAGVFEWIKLPTDPFRDDSGISYGPPRPEFQDFATAYTHVREWRSRGASN